MMSLIWKIFVLFYEKSLQRPETLQSNYFKSNSNDGHEGSTLFSNASVLLDNFFQKIFRFKFVVDWFI